MEINNETTFTLNNDLMEYQGKKFRMSLEHQFSYFVDFIMASLNVVDGMFPRTIKGAGEDYLTFNNKEEFGQFALTYNEAVRQNLSKGYRRKTAVESCNTREELESV